MAGDPLFDEIEQDIQTGHANLLRGIADMMRAVADDPMFPTPQFTTDVSAKGVTSAWAAHFDAAAESMDRKVS